MLSRRALFGSVALTAIGAAGAYLWVGRATKPRVFTGIQAGVALGGYDAVAYFTDGTPTPGREDLSLLHEALLGALPTTTTAKAFRADPGRYAPKYGGYCAYAVAGGGTSGGSPKAWRIVDGRLHLNATTRVQLNWEKDIPGYVRKADAQAARFTLLVGRVTGVRSLKNSRHRSSTDQLPKLRLVR